MEGKELTWGQRGRLWLRLGIRLAGAVIAVALVVTVLPPLLSLFMPFVLALVVAWLLNPLVRLLHQRLGISRKITSLLLILLLFCLVGGALGYFIYAVAAELLSLANNWQEIWDGLTAMGEQALQALAPLTGTIPLPLTDWADRALESLSGWLEAVIPAALTGLASGAGSLAMQVPTFVIGLIVFIMASYFITADYPHLRYQVSRLFGGRARLRLADLKAIVSNAFGGYLRAEFFLSVGVFFILLVGFALIGQSYALLIALLLAVMDFIPIIGAGTVMVPWAVIALITGDPGQAVELMVIWGIICLFRRVGEPKFVGTQTGLSPILSLVCIYVGMRIAGVLGMILGPILCLVVIGVGRSGFFDGLAADVRLAAADLLAILRDREERPE